MVIGEMSEAVKGDAKCRGAKPAEAGLAKRGEVLQSLASEVDAMVADAERGGGPQPHGETTVGWGSIRRIHQLLTDV